jgi:hypothetical protein
MAEPTETIASFVKRLDIKSSVRLIEKDEESWNYKVSYTCEGRDLTIEFDDYTENPPNRVALEALDEAADDAACIEHSKNLWEWCKAYYDLEPHNPVLNNPEEAYLIQRRLAKNLKAFLGDAEYFTLLFEVDRLYH